MRLVLAVHNLCVAAVGHLLLQKSEIVGLGYDVAFYHLAEVLVVVRLLHVVVEEGVDHWFSVGQHAVVRTDGAAGAYDSSMRHAFRACQHLADFGVEVIDEVLGLFCSVKKNPCCSKLLPVVREQRLHVLFCASVGLVAREVSDGLA